MKTFEQRKKELIATIRDSEIEQYEYSFKRYSRKANPDDYTEVYEYCDSVVFKFKSEEVVYQSYPPSDVFVFDASQIIETTEKHYPNVRCYPCDKDTYRVLFLGTIKKVEI